MANWEVWYCDPLGNRLRPLQPISIQLAIVQGGVGAAIMPMASALPLLPDYRLHFWRQAARDSLRLEFIAFIRRLDVGVSPSGLQTFTPLGYDWNDMLRRRVVAYYTDSSQAKKSDSADDLMKEIVDENLGDTAVTDYDGNAVTRRDITDYGFSIAADTGDGNTIDKSFAWRNLLKVLQDVQAATKTQSNEVFFGIVPTSPTTAQFRTAVTRWGNDRTAGANNPIVFSDRAGNFIGGRISYDYSLEANQIYAGGQGKGEAREIQESQDAGRQDVSAFNRRERFKNASQNKTAAGVLDTAKNELARYRPRTLLSGRLLSTPLTPYGGGNGWRVGDDVLVDVAGSQLNVNIKSAAISLSATGLETISGRVESL